MPLPVLAGNERIKVQLSLRERGRGLAHAYLISGPAGSGRHTLAALVTAAMVCSAPLAARPCGECVPCKKVLRGIHPDVQVFSGPGEGKPLTVDQVRQLRADAYVRPNEGERKVYWLEGADKMAPPAQNAMLKLLEEGPPYAAFLLLAENPGGLLQTIRSRCEELALTPVSPAECEQWLAACFPGKDPGEIRRAARSCQGILGRAVKELEDDGAGREQTELAQQLAQVLERGDELQVLRAAQALEKAGKEGLSPLLDALTEALGERLLQGGDRRRLMRAVGLVRQLRQAAQFNANPGQLAGWLCAGLFLGDMR